MQLNHLRRGTGEPLLLIHGLGGSLHSWDLVINQLAVRREVIAVDLPGHGATPPLNGPATIGAYADALAAWVRENDLIGVDAVGSSMGARLVLELARRGGVVGDTVALDPGGFWQGWQRHFFWASVNVSGKLVRLLQPVMPALTGSALGRTLLLAQFSAHPWTLPPGVALTEMRSFANTPVFDELLRNLAYGEPQEGMAAGAVAPHSLTIGWGDRDRVCFPSHARRAQELFPDARLYWFENCGHFPQWDSPQEASRLILDGPLAANRVVPAAPPENAGLRRLAGALVAVGLAVAVAGLVAERRAGA